MQSTPPKLYQQLQPEGRVTMASLLQQNRSLRDIAAVLKRSPSTIVGSCGATPLPQAMPAPQCLAVPKGDACGCPVGKLHPDGFLCGLMGHFPNERWSSEQVALTLAAIYP